MHLVKRLAAFLVLAPLAGSPARADTVDVTSTTMIRAGQETRNGTAGQKPELDTVAPAFEILSITARNVKNPLVDDLAIVLSTWGSYDFKDLRWDNGTDSRLGGDIQTGYLQGRLLDRRLTLRIGREMVMTGAARMIHLDGGEAIAVLPLGVRLSAYAGLPVSERFTSRRAIYNWNPAGGDLAYGGRAAWSYGLPGLPGRGVDLGVSANVVQDHGDPVRREVAGDARLQPWRDLTLTGFGAYSLYDDRWSEFGGRAAWSVTRALRLEADARHLAPDLLLARNSILSVFASEERNVYGAGAFYELGHGLHVGASWHFDLEPGRNQGDSKFLGKEGEARLEWERGHNSAGVEAMFLDALENGYVAGRVFGRREMGRFFAAADVLANLFRVKVNDEKLAVTGALTGGFELARGFSAVIPGRAGVTPFFEQTYDIMAKLVYNQSYTYRSEVR
jgi:hypothetical protein